MLARTETITWNTPRIDTNAAQRPVQRMRADATGRMAGSVPVWGKAQTPQEKITQSLAAAQSAAIAPAAGATPDFATSLRAVEEHAAPSPEFGFADLIDMVNPLQHIPLVSSLYREITGDEIKPISRIVGGAVFGGAVGAASSVANVVVEAETGKDIAGNLVALVSPDKPGSDDQAFEAVLSRAAGDAAPGNYVSNDTVIAVTNLRHTAQPRYNS